MMNHLPILDAGLACFIAGLADRAYGDDICFRATGDDDFLNRTSILESMTGHLK